MWWQRKVKLLIEPFWNWNGFILLLQKYPYESINRTILELKHVTNKSLPNSIITINRTILELKLHRTRRIIRSLKQLLIEPFWNWNWRSEGRERSTHGLLIEPFWNWNVRIGISVNGLSSINRTILELKLCAWFNSDSLTSLLIEPFWNWNVNSPCT